VAPGSTVYTDGLKSYSGWKEAGFKHVPRSQPLRVNLRKGAKSVVPLADAGLVIFSTGCLEPITGSVVINSKCIGMNSYFVTIGARPRQRRSQPCSLLERRINLPKMRRYGAHLTR
jgi:hypothetical protein